MSKENYDRSACQAYFENYNDCKKLWLRVGLKRRSEGIYPILPPLSERAAIKEKYEATGKIPITAKG